MQRLTLPFFALVIFFIAGCGQSGPLYMPGDPSTIVETSGSTASTPEAAIEDDAAETEDATDDITDDENQP